MVPTGGADRFRVSGMDQHEHFDAAERVEWGME
jgi:hypothetical protein